MKTRKIDHSREGEKIEKNVVADMVGNIDFFSSDNIWEVYNTCWTELKARGELKEDDSFDRGFKEGEQYVLSQVQSEFSYQMGKM